MPYGTYGGFTKMRIFIDKVLSQREESVKNSKHRILNFPLERVFKIVKVPNNEECNFMEAIRKR